MKKLRAFVFIFGWMSLINVAQAQSLMSDFDPKQYVVKVELATHRREDVGILYDLTDSTILLLPERGVKPILKKIVRQHGGILPPTDSLGKILPIRTYRYRDIRLLTVHRKNSLLKGAFIGAAVATAIMVVFSERDKEPKGFIDLPSKKEYYVMGVTASMPFLGIAAAAVMTKRINSREKSIAVEAQKRLREFTIVEQARQTALYRQ